MGKIVDFDLVTSSQFTDSDDLSEGGGFLVAGSTARVPQFDYAPYYEDLIRAGYNYSEIDDVINAAARSVFWGDVGWLSSNISFTNDTNEASGAQFANNYWSLILLVFPLLTVFGNVLVVLSVYRERSLQSVTNYFIVSLAIADIMVAILVMPLAVYVQVKNDVWDLGDALCDTFVALDVMCCTASILNLVAISVDRFFAVTQPISYASYKTSKRVHVLLALTWIISIAISSPIALGMNYTDRRTPDLCTFYNADFLIFSSMGSFYIPCIVMVLLYWRIFHAIRMRARKTSAAKRQRAAVLTVGSKEGGSGSEGGGLTMATGREANAKRGTAVSLVPPLMTGTTTADEGSGMDDCQRVLLPKHASPLSLSPGPTSPATTTTTVDVRLSVVVQETSFNSHGSSAVGEGDEEDEDGLVSSPARTDRLRSVASETAPYAKCTNCLLTTGKMNHYVTPPPPPPLPHRLSAVERYGGGILASSHPPNVPGCRYPATIVIENFRANEITGRDNPEEEDYETTAAVYVGGRNCEYNRPDDERRAASESHRGNGIERGLVNHHIIESDDKNICFQKTADIVITTDNGHGAKDKRDQAKKRKTAQSTSSSVRSTAAAFVTKFNFRFRRNKLGGGGKKSDRPGSGGISAASNAHRQERKATTTLAIVLGVFLICWVPFFTINIINAICIRYDLFDYQICQIDPILFSFFVWAGYMNSFLNPVIYTIFNTEFRRAFNKILHDPCKRNNYNI